MNSPQYQLQAGEQSTQWIAQPSPVPMYHPQVLSGGPWLSQLATQLSWVDFKPYSSVLRQCAQLSSDELHNYFIDIVETVEGIGQRRVDGAFVNYYRTGQDHCPYHRDMYGRDLLTVTFGGSRGFVLKSDANGTTQKVSLGDGDILTFPLAVNATHTHSVPKRAHASSRISLLCFLES
jgi:alkylated DNA repair dioxygenase AlkB